MNASRPMVSRGLLATIAALLAVMACASTASAVTGHRYTRSIGAGTLTGVSGVVVRAANNDLFALDPSALRVRRYTQSGDDAAGGFDVSGQVAAPTLLARNPSNGNLFVAGTDANGAPVAVRYTASGGSPTPIDLTQGTGVTGIAGIAADSSGRLYVSDTGTSQIRIYRADGVLGKTFDGAVSGRPAFSSVGPIAVDRTSNLYVVEPYVGLQKYTPLGAAFERTIGVGQPQNVGVDLTNDDVYVVDSPDGAAYGITRYLAGGARQERFGEKADASSYSAISVDGTSGTVFVGNPLTSLVDVFPTYVAPDVVTGDATGVTARTAEVAGTVNPQQQENTGYVFEFGTDTNYARSTASTDAGSGAADVPATGSLTDLLPNTTYHYRLKATNNVGSNTGADGTFTTAAAPPTVSDQNATNITRESATLSANVNPSNNPTDVYFEYGPTAGYGSNTRTADTLYGSDTQPVSLGIQALQPETTYHYRVVADNKVGQPTLGPDQTFTTPPRLPVATVGQAGVIGDTAQLSGTVTTQGLEGRVSFLVRATNSTYSTTTPEVALPAAEGARAVTASLSGLPSGGTFEVRVRVDTTTRTVVSEATTFSTAYVPSPALPAPLAFNPFPYAPITTPSNRFTASASVKGSTGTIKVKVPGRGIVTATGSRLSKATSRPTKAGTVSLKVKLTKSGRAALRKAKPKRLRIKVAVRYRPTDGTTRTGYRTLTFRR